MTSRLCVLVVALLTLAVWPAQAQQLRSATAAWDPADPADEDPTTGYRLQYGTLSGQYETVMDVGLVTSTAVPNLRVGVTYFFAVVAYDARGHLSRPSAEVAYTVPGMSDPNCAYPLGAKTISIFPTALQKTGNGGAGSRARLDFQVASPGSPVTAITIRANGVDVPGAAMGGTDLSQLAGMWFTVPGGPATYTFAVHATNAYGCDREVATPFQIMVK